MLNPEMEGGLDSPLRRVELHRLSSTHEDNRRVLTELFCSPDIIISDAKIMNIKAPPPGKRTVVGGHAEKGLEIQVVLSGEITLLELKDVVTGEEIEHKHLQACTKIVLPAGVVHRLTFYNAATLLVCNEIPFKPDKLVKHPFIKDQLTAVAK